MGDDGARALIDALLYSPTLQRVVVEEYGRMPETRRPTSHSLEFVQKEVKPILLSGDLFGALERIVTSDQSAVGDDIAETMMIYSIVRTNPAAFVG